jgi:hypothetical protein
MLPLDRGPLVAMPERFAYLGHPVWQEIHPLFQPHEFRFPFHMDVNFLILLHRTRIRAGVPFRIRSDHPPRRCQRRRPLRFFALRAVPGGSCEGGREELVEFCERRRSSSRTRPSRAATRPSAASSCTSSARIAARTAGEITSPAASSRSTVFMPLRLPHFWRNYVSPVNGYSWTEARPAQNL